MFPNLLATDRGTQAAGAWHLLPKFPRNKVCRGRFNWDLKLRPTAEAQDNR